MANTRDIKNRIKSISNTRKITSTMEMVSTAKMKKLQMRLNQSKPYDDKITQIMQNLTDSGVTLEGNPLFRKSEHPSRVMIFQITGNRGLCGSYNTNVIENTRSFRQKLESEGIDVDLYVIGKKAINFYKFMKESMFKQEVNPDDKVSFDDAAAFADELKNSFISGEYDEIYLSYTRVLSSTSQKPHIMRLLPILPEETESNDTAKSYGSDLEYIFEPNPDRIFSYILPLYLKMKVFASFLESAFSEHFARRVAMKNATDASKDMIRDLTLTYNRVRQAKITTEIAEIVGGAAALE